MLGYNGVFNSKEEIKQYIRNGGTYNSENFLDWKAISELNEIDIAELALEGYGNSFPDSVIKKLPQEIINRVFSKGFCLEGISKDQIRAIPHNIVLKLISERNYKVMRLIGSLDDYVIDIPYDDLVQYIRSTQNPCLNKRSFNTLSSDMKLEYINKGGNLYTAFGNVTRDNLPEEVQNLLDKATMKIEFVKDYDFAIYQIDTTQTDYSVDKLVELIISNKILGWWPEGFFSKIPQEKINELVDEGYYLGSHFIGKEKFEKIPNELKLKMSIKYGCINYGFQKYLRSVIPFEEVGAYNILVNYALGKIKKEDIPDVFFRDAVSVRHFMLIAKTKMKNKFMQICASKGYKDNVPKEIVEVFDKKVAQLEKYIEQRRQIIYQHDLELIRENEAKIVQETADEVDGGVDF